VENENVGIEVSFGSQAVRESIRAPSPGAAVEATGRDDTLRAVNARDLRDLVHFDEDGPRHAALYETGRLWSEVVCLDRNQALGPITDPDSDAIVVVVTGRVVVQVDRGRKRREQWETALVEAGSELSITNASPEPAVVLLVAAPPPPKRAITE
jgi:quercetin dioxygenase-like cupin family protein